MTESDFTCKNFFFVDLVFFITLNFPVRKNDNLELKTAKYSFILPFQNVNFKNEIFLLKESLKELNYVFNFVKILSSKTNLI